MSLLPRGASPLARRRVLRPARAPLRLPRPVWIVMARHAFSTREGDPIDRPAPAAARDYARDVLTKCACARAARHRQRTIGRVEPDDSGRLAIWQASTQSE